MENEKQHLDLGGKQHGKAHLLYLVCTQLLGVYIKYIHIYFMYIHSVTISSRRNTY